MLTTAVIAISSGVLVLVTIISIARHFEKRDFNNGYCKLCNSKLKNFDTDSQGGRGYICDCCGYSTWVSYNADKQFLEEE